jgi:8-oxo-dGTP diphosphatase
MPDNKNTQKPRVGTGIFILNNASQVLLLKRQGSHGAGSWCPPGGHLEWRESFLDCAIRETKEETDIDIKSIEVVGVTSDIFPEEDNHYVTVFMKAKEWSGNPKLMEPDKSTEINWFDLDKLPSPMFISDQNFFKLNTFCLCGSGLKYNECHEKAI